MASVTVSIIFSGLVTLVPSGTEKNPGPIRVLLAESSAHLVSADGCRLPRHYPLLAIYGPDSTTCEVTPAERSKDCVETTQCKWQAPSFLKPGNTTKNPQWGWLLDGELLEFEGVTGPDGVTLKYNKDKKLGTFPCAKDECKSYDDRVDYRWIANPPAMADPDSECLNGADCPLAARAKIAKGDLTACHFAALPEKVRANGATGKKAVYPDTEKLVLPAFRWGRVHLSVPERMQQAFSPFLSPSTRPQAHADAFQVTFQVEQGKPFTLKLRKFDDLLGVGRRIVVKPTEDIQIWVENVADPRAAHLDTECFQAGIDRHFEVLYDSFVTSSKKRCPVNDVKVPHASREKRDLSDYRSEAEPISPNTCDILSFPLPIGMGGDPPHDKTACVVGRSNFSGGSNK